MGKRVEEVAPDQLDERQRAIYKSIRASRGNVAGPFMVWLHSPEFANKAQRLGKYLRYDTSLEPRISELAILTTARAWDCQNEWSIHEPFALKAGLSQETVDGIRQGERTVSRRADEQRVYEYVRELLENHFVTDAVFQAASVHLGKQGLVELTGLLGYYTLVALTMNAFQTPVPDGVEAGLTDCPTFR